MNDDFIRRFEAHLNAACLCLSDTCESCATGEPLLDELRAANPEPIDPVRLARALMASVGANGWLRSTPSDPAVEWLVNAEVVARAYAQVES